MSEKEFGIFAMALKTYFPKDNLFPNKQSVDLWYRILNDIDYKTAELFLQKWVATNKWSPTIADIREGCADITHGEIQDWGKAWEQVEKAIRYFGMYREDEAYASMDEITEEVTRRLGFKEICMSENLQVDRANFRMIYFEKPAQGLMTITNQYLMDGDLTTVTRDGQGWLCKLPKEAVYAEC